MFRIKSTLVLAIMLLLALASSAMALDIPTLRQNMWVWSSLESVLHDSHGSGHGIPPVVPPAEAQDEIEKARAIISKIVASIDNAKDMAEARAVAAEFVSMSDHEEEVGKSLHKLLDMQEKYLKAHSGK